MTRCGIVAVVGLPNAGKSSLLNRLVGAHLAITSPRPQSTRQRVIGILSSEHAQIIFADTPGLLDPRYHLQRVMATEIRSALQDADVVLHLIDAARDTGPQLDAAASALAASRAPVLHAFNKWDLVSPETRARLLEEWPLAIPISATTGDGVDALVSAMELALPEGPFLYDPDDVSSQNMRFFACEALREAAFNQLDEELPYAVHAEIDEFRESSDPVYIRATLYVERDSQKGILIGAKGARIREIGRAARTGIEELLGTPVYLDLHVKVLPNWRRNLATLQRLGFQVPKE